MFVFNLELQGDMKVYLIRRQKRGLIRSAIITALIFFVPAIIIGTIWGDNFIIRTISISLTIFSLLFLICFSRWNSPLNGFYEYIPQSIVIDTQQEIIETIGNAKYSYQRKELQWVKEIIDFGGWYEFNFYGQWRNSFFICQKDLIIEGTIEDFEKLFEGLIVRKYEGKD